MPVALITGGSAGLGLELGKLLAAEGWSLVVDGRREEPLRAAEAAFRAAGAAGAADVTALVGDVADDAHRRALAAAAPAPDLLVNNASELGASPLPTLAEHPLDALRRVFEVNVVAPIALVQLLDARTIVNVSSDAAVEAYETWGGYGSSKAALDHASAVLAAERPDRRVYAVDPGDMRTAMHQAAFAGEDISDRPEPAEAARNLRNLLAAAPASGRHRAADFAGVPA